MYCTVEDLLLVLRQSDLSAMSRDEFSAESEIEEDLINGVIMIVSDTIDGYLRARYSLPISEGEVPPSLRDVALTLCKYKLWVRTDENAPEGLKSDRDKAIEFLRSVQRGDVLLNIPGVNGIARPKSVLVSTRARAFTNETLSRFP